MKKGVSSQGKVTKLRKKSQGILTDCLNIKLLLLLITNF